MNLKKVYQFYLGVQSGNVNPPYLHPHPDRIQGQSS